MSEQTEVLKPIIRLLIERGIPHQRINSGAFKLKDGGFVQGSAAGTPDIVIGVPSRHGYLFGWIECKVPTGKLSYLQCRFLKDANAKGLPWCVADSVADVIRFLDEPDYHGKAKLIAPVLDPDYKWEEPARREHKQRPSEWDGLIEAQHERIKANAVQLSEIPF